MSDALPTEIPEAENSHEDAVSEVAEATLTQIPPPELERYKISFSDYKEDKCTISGMNGKNAQMAIKIIRDIGLNFKSQDYFSSKQTNQRLEIKPVINSSPYDVYYRGLPDEVQDSEEVKEIKYTDDRPDKEADLRIFYYTLSNIFYMLAITANVHENLDHKTFAPKKHRRKW